MDVPQIKNRKNLAAWLIDRNPEEQVIVAYRAALRVSPLFLAYSFGSRQEVVSLSEGAFVRAFLRCGTIPSFPKVHSHRRIIDSGPFAAGEVANAADYAAAAFAQSDVIKATQYASYAVRRMSVVYDADGEGGLRQGEAMVSASKTPEFWNEIWTDLSNIADGENPMERPLWLSGNSPLAPQWETAKTRLAAKDEDWSFWIRLYEGALRGQPLDPDLQREILKIDEELWVGEQKSLAAAIAAIEKKYEPRLVSREQAVGPLIQTAHTDYSFDSLRKLMKMIPFDQDISRVKDPKVLQRFLDDSQDFQLLLNTLVNAATESERQTAKSLKVYADELKAELARAHDLGELRVGILIDLGESLQDFSGDEDVRLGLGPALPKALSRVVDRLLDLLRSYFSPAMSRMEPLRGIHLTEGEDSRALIKQVMDNLSAIKRNGAAIIPDLLPEDMAALERLVEEVKRAGRNYEAATHPEVKAELGDILAQKSSQVTFDKALYIYRGLQAVQIAVGGKDDNVADTVMRRVLLLHTASEIAAWLPSLISLIL